MTLEKIVESPIFKMTNHRVVAKVIFWALGICGLALASGAIWVYYNAPSSLPVPVFVLALCGAMFVALLVLVFFLLRGRVSLQGQVRNLEEQVEAAQTPQEPGWKSYTRDTFPKLVNRYRYTPDDPCYVLGSMPFTWGYNSFGEIIDLYVLCPNDETELHETHMSAASQYLGGILCTCDQCGEQYGPFDDGGLAGQTFKHMAEKLIKRKIREMKRDARG